jgi:DNA-binding MarR family transcriptional regulator
MNREYQKTERTEHRQEADRVALAFRSVIASVVLHNYETAEAVGLSPRDMQAIHLLQLRGPMTPGELGRAVGLASASTTALVDRLESAGYARRERDREDRRKVVISLVEDRLARDLAPRYAQQAQQLERALARFNASELRTIGNFLHALTGPEESSAE